MVGVRRAQGTGGRGGPRREEILVNLFDGPDSEVLVCLRDDMSHSLSSNGPGTPDIVPQEGLHVVDDVLPVCPVLLREPEGGITPKPDASKGHVKNGRGVMELRE